MIKRIILTFISIITVVGVVASMVGCGSDKPATGVGQVTGGQTQEASAIQEPKTLEAAHSLLDRAMARGSSGDDGGVWDLLYPEDQALINREGYVTYQATCNADNLRGFPYTISDTRFEEESTVLATVSILGFVFPLRAYYVDGHWMTELSESNRAGAEHWAMTTSCL